MLPQIREWLKCLEPFRRPPYSDDVRIKIAVDRAEAQIYMASITDAHGKVSVAAMCDYFRRKASGEPVTMGEPAPPEPIDIERVVDDHASCEWLDGMQKRMLIPSPFEAMAIRQL